MSPCLALHLLGPPKLDLDNAPVAADRRKTLALLAYLALNRGQHTRDYLSALFWAEYGQSKAFTNLRHTLWETGQALGEGWGRRIRNNRDSALCAWSASSRRALIWGSRNGVEQDGISTYPTG